MFEKLESFTKSVSNLPDKPASGSAAELKAAFDAAPEEVRVYLNKLIDALKKTTESDSGAKNIGATSIAGLSGTDVQTILDEFKKYVDTSFGKRLMPALQLSRSGWGGLQITPGTFPKIVMNSEKASVFTYDSGASQIIIPENGFYLFNTYSICNGTAADGNVYAYIWNVTKNASKGIHQRTNANGAYSLNGSTLWYCNKDEVLEFQVQNLAATLVTLTRVEFSVHKVTD